MALGSLIKNDTWKIRVDIKDPTSGNPVNIEGDTVHFTMKTNTNDPDGSAVLQVSAASLAGADAQAGFHVFVINWNDPAGQNSAIAAGPYNYDFQHQAIGSGSGEITSLAAGKVSVSSDVTVTPA